MDHVFLNNKGFTLVEFLVAIVILMIGMLGLLQAVNVAINSNMQTQFRNEALVVADRAMAHELAKGFNSVSTTTKSEIIQRNVAGAFKNYSVTRNPTGSNNFENSKEIRFRVSWSYKGTRYDHDAGGVISRERQ
jgi:type IV pilus assembly protein PilV